MKKLTLQNINFDSVFTPAGQGKAASLEIVLKLGLLPYDPIAGQDANGKPKGHAMVKTENDVKYGKVRDDKGLFNCKTWLEGNFNVFRIKLKAVVEFAWNNQIILVPPSGRNADDDLLSDPTLNEMRTSVGSPPYIEGKLRITFWDPNASADLQGKGPHGKMFVAMLDRADKGEQGKTYFDGERYRSRMTLICHEDLQTRAQTLERGGELFRREQVTAAHEVGHWLGQPVPDTDQNRVFLHIDEGKCNAKLAEDCAYGSTKERTRSMMGAGSRTLLHDAEPWLQRAREHSGAKKGWSFIHRDHLKAYLQTNNSGG